MNQLTPEQLDLIKRLQPLFKEKMGERRIHGDCYYCLDCDKYDVYFYGLPDLGHNTIIIPKPIDWQNPERGLWGMIDWTKFHGRVMPSGDMWIFTTICYGQHILKYIDDPFTALLKALCEQENL